jgi:hypothetical protein
VEDEEGGDATGAGLPSIYSSKKNWTSSFAPQYIQKSGLLGGHSRLAVSDDEDDEDPPGFLDNPRALDSSTSTAGELETIRLADNEPPEDIVVESQQYVDRPNSIGLSQMGVKAYDPPGFDSPPSLRASSPVSSYVPPELPLGDDSPRFDAVWGTVYIAFVAMVFATSLMIWLTTSSRGVPLGDTIYQIIRSSWPLLFIDTLIAVAISAAWVYCMKNYSSVSVYALIVSVPVGFVFLSIYPRLMSYKSGWGGDTAQDRAMRWTSLVPLVLACLWIGLLYVGRHALDRSLVLIRLSCSILSSNRPLILLSAGIIGACCTISLVWLSMFTRLFLQGQSVVDHGKSSWILDPKSWALGAAYILMYLWTLGVLSGVQRCVITATVSQWYFHRHNVLQPSSARIVNAAVHYSLTAQFGTICLSSLLCLLARLPLIVLPKRVVGAVQLLAYSLVSQASVLSLTNPLALTNAVINGHGLVDSATTVGHTLATLGRSEGSLTAHRLAKILLSACRCVTALFMGFGGWIHAARYTSTGSLYGYIVGILAGLIGWFVIGIAEGTLSMIVDAAFICFAIDNSAGNGGHCPQADRLFGGY